MSKKTNVSLHNIEGVRSIEDLAPHYDLIKSHLLVLTNKRGEDIEDLMQDFYIKMYNYFEKYPSKVINGGFVSNTLRNMLRNYYSAVSKNKTEYEHSLVDKDDNDLEIEDNEATILNIERSKSEDGLDQTLRQYKDAFQRKTLEYESQRDSLVTLRKKIADEFNLLKELQLYK